MLRGLFAAALLVLFGCANSKPYQPLDYDKMGLDTTNIHGKPGEPALTPDSERLGHEKIEALQVEATKARAEGAKAVEGLTPATAPTPPKTPPTPPPASAPASKTPAPKSK
jgi:hypothetical protein